MTRDELKQIVVQELPDNNAQKITAKNLRDTLNAIIDNVTTETKDLEYDSIFSNKPYIDIRLGNNVLREGEYLRFIFTRSSEEIQLNGTIAVTVDGGNRFSITPNQNPYIFERQLNGNLGTPGEHNVEVNVQYKTTNPTQGGTADTIYYYRWKGFYVVQ